MRKPHLAFAIMFISGLTFSCNAITGEEVARLPVNFVSSEDSTLIKEVSLDLKKDDAIVFWSDMDVEYKGDVGLRFRIQVLKNGDPTGTMEIDPTDKNVTLGETKVVLMDKTSWSFNGRNTKVVIDDDGKYTFRALLVSSDNPTLKINKAELVIKK